MAEEEKKSTWRMMGDDEKKAFERVLAELRKAIESMPALEHAVPAEQLMFAAFTVGVNDEAKYRLGYEVTQLMMARVTQFIALRRARDVGPSSD